MTASNTSAPRIIFMGTPAFAVAILDGLMDAGMEVAAVVTAPDRPAGRGRQLRASAVKERALQLGLPVLQPERLRDQAFLDELDRIGADLYVVVAFRMLPEVVWTKPRLGTINLHASLLPDYRGAAPINWAVINGEQRTGLTTFLIGHDIDTGDILLQEEMSIGSDETAGELHDRMMAVGAQLVVTTVKGLASNTLHPRPQAGNGALHAAPKIHAQDCRMDVQQDARQVHDHVRGMSPFPGAWCRLMEDGRDAMHFKVLRTRLTGSAVDAEAGTVRTPDHAMQVACQDEWLELLEVQAEGKRRMTAAEFLRGLPKGTALRIG
jgi:methionyl-tRNA formyltransferase